MAKKPNISTVTSGYQGTATLNSNFQNIRDQFDNTLSRDGSTPNAMLADLDMNGYAILNVGAGTSGGGLLTVDAADLRYVNQTGDTMTGSLTTPALYTNGLFINGNPVLPDTLSYNGIVKETKIATSGQTVFNLSSISYTPGINNLAVYVDGVYQRPANYTETNATRVTFSVGLHVGAIVDFVVLTINSLSGTADATNLTYTAPGTGADTRTVYSRLSDVISVKDFGATGDGSTDDTAAIQDAINSGATSIYVPRGTYKLTSTINITQPIRFFGAGRNATIFTVAGTFDVFYINGGVSVISGMQMSDFQITNTLSRVSVTDGAGIRMYLSYFGMFSNILIHNCYYGIRSRQSNVTRYDAVDVTDFNYVGYLFNEGFNFDSYVANCVISGGGGGFSSVKLEDMCDEMTFYSVIMNTSQYNLHCDASAFGVNLRPEFCRFFACSFDSSTTGVFLRHTSDMTFTGCFFSNRPGNGAQIGTTSTVENTNFIGCSFYNCGGSGIVVGAFATDTLFDGCNFIGNSQATVNTGNGLTIAANTNNFTVVNSTFRNGWGSSGSQNYGLAVLSGTSDRFIIANNNFGTNGTGGAMLLGALGTNRTVSGNVGVKTKASGEATILNGNSSVVVTHGLFSQPASYNIILTPALLPAVDVYVSAVSATTFTISTVNPVGADLRVNWVAAILGN